MYVVECTSEKNIALPKQYKGQMGLIAKLKQYWNFMCMQVYVHHIKSPKISGLSGDEIVVWQ